MKARSVSALLSVGAVAAASVIAFGTPAHAATTTVSTWADLKTAVAAAGTNTVLLGADLTGTNDNLALNATGDLTLDLNGRSLTITAATPVANTDAAPAGIVVPSGATLRINATGGGNLTVTGATGWTNPSLTGVNHGGGAAIGGLGASSLATLAASQCGTVVVNAGTLRLTGGAGGGGASTGRRGGNGAGIGGGGGSGNLVAGAGCTVAITGGDIVATGATDLVGRAGGGAGIGAGGSGSGTVTVAAAATGTLSLAGSGTPSTGGSGRAGFAPAPLSNGAAGAGATGSVITAPGRYFTSTAIDGVAFGAGGSVTVQYSFDVSFDPQNTTATQVQRVNYGVTATVPGTPVRAGYTFGGWRVGSSAGSSYDFSSVVTGPFTLFANWTLSASPSTPSPTTSPTLAKTGAEPGGLGWLGLALLVFGAAGLVAVRSRRSES